MFTFAVISDSLLKQRRAPKQKPPAVSRRGSSPFKLPLRDQG
jgi:hypothetical protein